MIVNLKTIRGVDRVDVVTRAGLHDRRADHARRPQPARRPIRRQYAVLAEAAESVATPQIRNVGTLAGNVCQRPWCWYFRNGFPCYKAGGKQCFSVAGENQFHAIFGGGPSYIVHPSDTAPALVALDARFQIAGPAGERTVPAPEFFVLPRQNPATRERAGRRRGAERRPGSLAAPGTRSTYHKVLDREAWTHAVVSAAVVLEMEQDVCRSARDRAGRRRADSLAPAGGREAAGWAAHHAELRSRPARRPSPAPGRSRRTPTRCR